MNANQERVSRECQVFRARQSTEHHKRTFVGEIHSRIPHSLNPVESLVLIRSVEMGLVAVEKQRDATLCKRNACLPFSPSYVLALVLRFLSQGKYKFKDVVIVMPRFIGLAQSGQFF